MLPQPSLPGVTHRTVRVGDLDVHVAEAGDPDGPPLVLVHGWPQHWWTWRHAVPLLADHRLVLPDLRGHGWTSAPRTGYDKEQLALDLLGLLDALQLPRVGLVGHDWGGWVGFLACLRAPQRFTGLVALGIAPPAQRPDRRLLGLWRGAYQVVLGTPGLGEALLRGSTRTVEAVLRLGATRQEAFTDADVQVFAQVLQEAPRARASSALYRAFVLGEAAPVFAGAYARQRLTVPTRLVVGADDPVITAGLLEGATDWADDLRVTVLPGCGHFVAEERPDAVVTALRSLPAAPTAAR